MTIDGLGGEELGQPGSQASSLWLTGSVVSESLINASNFNTGAAVGQDGTMSGLTISGGIVVAIA